MKQNRTLSPQDLASDPAVWSMVRAAAGSGKTHLLISRMLRLYFAGADTTRLMATTFTVKAANEMKERLVQRGEELLRGASDSLCAQLGVAPDHPDIPVFFWDLLDNFSRLRFSTIDSFCHRIVARFPLECDVPIRVQLPDGVQGAELFAIAFDGFLEEIRIGDPSQDPLAKIWSDLDDQEIPPSRLKELFLAAVQQVNLWRFWSLDVLPASGQPDPLLTSDPRTLADLVVERLWNGYVGAPRDEAITGARAAMERSSRWSDLVGWLQAARRAKTARILAEDLSQRPPFETLSVEDQTAWARRLEETLCAGTETTQWKQSLVAETGFHEARSAWSPLLKVQAAEQFENYIRLTLAFLHRYHHEKRRRGLLEFADIEWFAWRLLDSGTTGFADFVLLSLSWQLQHLAVDEFQDTSLIQWKILEPLLSMLSSTALEQPGTVFCVGDLKQSIYRFRNAEPELMAVAALVMKQQASLADSHFHEVQLPDSFRSAPAVLRFVEMFFKHQTELRLPPGESTSAGIRRVGVDSWGQVIVEPVFMGADLGELQEGGEGTDGLGEPAGLPTPATRYQQQQVTGSSPVQQAASWLAETVQGLVGRAPVWDKELRAHRPAVFADILVLLETRTYAPVFEDAFKIRGIPYVTSGRASMAQRTEFQDVLALLRFVENPQDDLALVFMLRGPLFRLTDDDLQQWTAQRPRHRRGDSGRAQSLWGTLNHSASDLAMPVKLRQMLPELNELAVFRRRRPSELFLFLQNRYSLVQRYEEIFNPGKAANLRLFWTAALSLEGRGVATIGRFRRYLEKMADSRDLTDAPLPAGAGTGAVRFLTIHGAKGLEAPVVILPDTARSGPPGGPQFLPVRTNATREIAMLLPHLGGQYPLQDPPGVPRTDVYLDAQDQEVARGAEEDASLAYVALTRARDYLFIAGFMNRARASYDRTIHGACTAALDKAPREPGDPEVRLVSEDVGSPGEDGEIPRWCRRHILESGVRPQAVSTSPAPTPPKQPDLCRLPEGRSVLLEVRHPSTRAGRKEEEPTTGEVQAVPRVRTGSEELDPRAFGNAVHRILGWLGTTGQDRDIASGRNPGPWKADALALSAAELPDEHLAGLAVQHVESLLDDASLAWMFQTSSLSEQPMILQSGDKTVQYGIADRVVLEENRITVVDYKTHASAGPVPEEVMQGYHDQVTQYMACLEAVCPGRPVRGCLLWTHSHRLDWVPVAPNCGNPQSNTPE